MKHDIILKLSDLELPEDVLENSPESIMVYYGRSTNSGDLVILLTQYKRVVFSAAVGSITHNYKTGNDEIRDAFGAPTVIVKPQSLKTINGINYTMFCVSDQYDIEAFDLYYHNTENMPMPEKITNTVYSNWLY